MQSIKRPVIKRVVCPSFELGKYHFLEIFTTIVNFFGFFFKKKYLFISPQTSNELQTVIHLLLFIKIPNVNLYHSKPFKIFNHTRILVKKLQSIRDGICYQYELTTRVNSTKIQLFVIPLILLLYNILLKVNVRPYHFFICQSTRCILK